MTDRIERLEEAFRAFGYVVIAEPVLNSEDLFADTLCSALSKVELTFSINAKRYHFRGRSRNALAALHAAIPHPCFGVEVRQ
ncbi:hypothetical protein HFN89_06855 [Rhizobium laguerreae]|nr:hypothetical protein [Rhizobium laguerreae]